MLTCPDDHANRYNSSIDQTGNGDANATLSQHRSCLLLPSVLFCQAALSEQPSLCRAYDSVCIKIRTIHILARTSIKLYTILYTCLFMLHSILFVS